MMKKMKMRDRILIGSAIVIFLISRKVLSNLFDAAEAVGDATADKNSEFHILKIALFITLGYCIIYYSLYGIISIANRPFKQDDEESGRQL